MKYTIELPDNCDAVIQKECDNYNSRPGQDPSNVPLTVEEFLATLVAPSCAVWMAKYDVATTTDMDVLKEAIKADPAAVKAAIMAQEQKEADAEAAKAEEAASAASAEEARAEAVDVEARK